jgi:hypothetical protein
MQSRAQRAESITTRNLYGLTIQNGFGKSICRRA